MKDNSHTRAEKIKLEQEVENMINKFLDEHDIDIESISLDKEAYRNKSGFYRNRVEQIYIKIKI